MRNGNAFLVRVLCLLVAFESRRIAAQTPSPISDLFDDSMIAGNVAVVCERANQLPDEERFAFLSRWVLPSESHSSIRINGDFTQTNPAPLIRPGVPPQLARGGTIRSPVFQLLDVAKRTNRLPELLALVDAVPQRSSDEPQRAKVALQTMIHLELGDTNEAAKASDRLLQLVRTSRPKSTTVMWPETLVVYRHVVNKQSLPGNDELLGYLFSQRTQLDYLPHELQWHSQIAALAGEHGHRESPTPTVSSPDESQLTQWIPISRRKALTRGLGLANSRWGRAGSQVFKISGHDDDYLFFRSPLTGDFEVQCDVTAFTTQTMTAGTFLGNDGDRSHLWIGTFRNSARRIDSDFTFSGFDDWIHQRSVVQNRQCVTSLNGHIVHTEPSASSLDPWFAVRNWWRMHAAARDIRISGNPVIPECVDLSALEDLRGWYPYFDESVGRPGAVWEHIADRASSGIILGHKVAPTGSFCESLLAYQRPLESVGSIEYEFFYAPGRTEVHPALDRMVFRLQPDGVRIHWLTDGSLDRTELRPDNLSEPLAGREEASRLPLKPGEWNRLKMAVDQHAVVLSLNGQQIVDAELDPLNDRVFGLFHYADQTEAKVRNIHMRGNWPKTLPGIREQEAADNRPEQLDADLTKLTDVFHHDFSRAGTPDRFFTVGQNQPGGMSEVIRNGWRIQRPGGGPWYDTFVNLPFMVHGDFEIEIAFEDFKAIGDEFGCIMLVVEMDDEKRRQCRILRIRDELQRQELHASISELHQDGNRSYSSRPPKKTEAAAGRLRLARRGTTLYYLFAENDSSEFRVLETEVITEASSVADGLHFHTMCNGNGETSVVWKSITIRAERLTLRPDPTERQTTNLYSINSDGSNLHRLAAPSTGFIQIASGEWSGDGTKIIADMQNGGVETSRIVLMNRDGSDMKDLGPGCMPSLSPDNKEIVFSQVSNGVKKMKIDGSGRTSIDPNGWGTQWSPNGSYIAWAAGNNIVLLDRKTNKRSQLLTGEQSAQLSSVYWNFGWSQNSQSIAFKARKRDSTGSVVAISDIIDPKHFAIVYDGPEQINEDLSVSPDGGQVLISLRRPQAPAAKLFSVNRDTPGELTLVSGQPESWNVQGGDWSPDGKRIAFSATVPPQPKEWPLE